MSRFRNSIFFAAALVAGPAQLPAPAAVPGPPPPVAQASAQAQGVFEAIRPSVVQVQTLPLGSDSPFGHGTGFAVAAGKLILTNYHVVSSVVIDPDRYRLEFLKQDGSKGALSVVAIDVVHDLALVRGDFGPMPGLEFDPRIPEKGARGFSIGFPRNVGITVTEGVINGLSEDSTRGAIHFSGPMNGGMSGGPAVTPAGKVFGVNVATLRSSQLISFVVPAGKAMALIERATSRKESAAPDLIADLTRQLRASSEETLGQISVRELPIQTFGRFRAPGKPGEFARCSARNEKEADKLYHIAQYGCRLKDATYVANDLYLGHWDFSHRHLTAPKLGALRFAGFQERLLEAEDDTSTTNRIHKTRWACQQKIVNQGGSRSKAVLCLRRYQRLEGLYDLDLKLVSLADPGESLVSTLSINGFGYPESMLLARRFMEAIAWKR